MWGEIRGGVEMAMPLLMKAAMIYLVVRFALVISSVIARLGMLNSPPPEVQYMKPEEGEHESAGETEDGPPDGRPALPVSSTDS